MVSNTDTSNPFASVVNESDTYLIAKYKEWCMSNPDTVCYEDSKVGNSREHLVRNFFETKAESCLADLFEKERKSTFKSDDKPKYTLQHVGVLSISSFLHPFVTQAVSRGRQ